MLPSHNRIVSFLDPGKCSRCGSSNPSTSRETSSYRFGYYVLFTRHQSVNYTAPLCNQCAIYFDKWEKNAGIVLILLLGISALYGIFGFFYFSPLLALIRLVAIVVATFFLISLMFIILRPKLAKFDGNCIRPLREKTGN
jgi:hypothetical protein